jgi:hypothetical protein
MRPHVGDARLSGVVVTTLGGQPLANAQINVVDGPSTRANERGEWTIGNAPSGTRMLEVRAVGYYPERRPIDAMADAPPIRTSLATMKSVLDTVRVSATRDRQFSGFEDRRKTGVGRYISAADIAKRSYYTFVDLLRTVPELRIERGNGTSDDPTESGTRILMRGTFSDWCAPAIFIDGGYAGVLTADEIDGWMRPQQIAGIEVYRGPGIPPQFDRSMAGDAQGNICGSVVIWRK